MTRRKGLEALSGMRPSQWLSFKARGHYDRGRKARPGLRTRAQVQAARAADAQARAAERATNRAARAARELAKGKAQEAALRKQLGFFGYQRSVYDRARQQGLNPLRTAQGMIGLNAAKATEAVQNALESGLGAKVALGVGGAALLGASAYAGYRYARRGAASPGDAGTGAGAAG